MESLLSRDLFSIAKKDVVSFSRLQLLQLVTSCRDFLALLYWLAQER